MVSPGNSLAKEVWDLTTVKYVRKHRTLLLPSGFFPLTVTALILYGVSDFVWYCISRVQYERGEEMLALRETSTVYEVEDRCWP